MTVRRGREEDISLLVVSSCAVMASEGLGDRISIDGDSSDRCEAVKGEAVRVRTSPSWWLEST